MRKLISLKTAKARRSPQTREATQGRTTGSNSQKDCAAMTEVERPRLALTHDSTESMLRFLEKYDEANRPKRPSTIDRTPSLHTWNPAAGIEPEDSPAVRRNKIDAAMEGHWVDMTVLAAQAEVKRREAEKTKHRETVGDL